MQVCYEDSVLELWAKDGSLDPASLQDLSLQDVVSGGRRETQHVQDWPQGNGSEHPEHQRDPDGRQGHLELPWGQEVGAGTSS